MGILRLGKQIRLNGEDAEAYLRDTGRHALPTTVREYNRALQEAAICWSSIDCPEGQLLAVICEQMMIPDT
jgi:hypothetical protein